MKKLIKVFLTLFAFGALVTSCSPKGPSIKLTEIKISNDVKTSYEYNDEFVKPTVTAYYDNLSNKVVTDQSIFTGFDSTKPGDQTINVSYTESSITKTTSYLVTIKNKPVVLESIELKDKVTSFKYGEEFKKCKVIAHYDDKSQEDVTDKATFTGYNKTLSGNQTITVTYLTKSDTYQVTVGAPISLNKIELVGTYKTTYIQGDEFEKPNVKATFSDSSEEDVTSKATFTGYNLSTLGNQTVTVSYTYLEVTKETSYQITVNEASTKLKFAIFADVQLCNDQEKTASTGLDGQAATTNLGSTANAPIALKNHLKFIKDQGINVVLMNGDITNQANENYYDYFERILKEVYGEDESTYPEFVYNMGNHEWWWETTEKETGDGVALFKKHARISSSNLVAESTVKYQNGTASYNSTVPSYYKVINGVPFIVISGESSDGNVGSTLRGEIESWLNQANNLDSVKKGGPIFVEYHCPLSTSMTHGQGSGTNAAVIEDIFKNTPNAVIFTGDTHYPGNNERSINQVNFTTINLGSSSYSRMVNASATICDDYDNVRGTGSKIGDKLYGNVKFKEAYTPTIQIVDVKENNTFTVDRYFSSEEGAYQVGNRWNFSTINSKEDFTYTNARFENKDASKALYGKEGLSWEDGSNVTFGIDEVTGNMTVRFPEVNEYHYCEHYRINVNGQIYDEVSNYYKYLKVPEENYYILENVDKANEYQVSVTAYDFFDNPSLNTLTSSTNNPNIAIDAIDNQSTATYCDIQTRVNVTDVAPNSHSSVEFYYKGYTQYNYGAILNRVISNEKATDVDCSSYLSMEHGLNKAPVLSVKAKNRSINDMKLGITVVDKSGKWHTDFGVEHQKTISGSDWVEVSWDLYTLFNITSADDLRTVGLKAKMVNASSSGYEMDILIDDLDITTYDIETPEPGRNPERFIGGQGYSKNITEVSLTETLTIDLKIEGTGNVALMLGDGWNDYFGYFDIKANSSGELYTGVTAYSTDDGYIRVIFDLSKLNKKEGNPTKVNLVYLRDIWTDASGYIEINPTKGEIIRGKAFKAGEDNTTNITNVPLTGTLVIDFKFTSGTDTHCNLILGQGWNDYFGYFKIKADGTLGENYTGVTIEKLADGYIRVSFDLTKVNKVNDKPAPTEYINLVYMKGSWTTGTGFIDINPSV